MKLGQLIDRLAAMPPKLPVRFRRVGDAPDADGVAANDGDVPGRFDSYRGYYDRLMLAPERGKEAPTVEDVLTRARMADGATFCGYKGGDFTMSRDTLVHVAEWGRTSDDRIVGVQETAAEVALLVASVEEW